MLKKKQTVILFCCLLTEILAEYYNEGTKEKKLIPINIERDNLSPCSEKITKFSSVLAQGRFVLFKDPQFRSCSELQCESLNGLEWQERQCVPGPERGWLWFEGFRGGENNSYRIFHRSTKDLYINETRYFLPEEPPRAGDAVVYAGRGVVHVVMQPVTEAPAPNLLGYRVSLTKAGSNNWEVVGELDVAVYRCSVPYLVPRHPCPHWLPRHGTLCLLFSDSIQSDGAASGTNATIEYVKIETFRLPLRKEYRFYSRGYMLPLYDSNAKEELKVSKTARGSPKRARAASQALGDLWAIFAGLTFSVILVALPLAHDLASRAGLEEAEDFLNGDQPKLRIGSEKIASAGKSQWTLKCVKRKYQHD